MLSLAIALRHSIIQGFPFLTFSAILSPPTRKIFAAMVTAFYYTNRTIITYTYIRIVRLRLTVLVTIFRSPPSKAL